MKIEIESTIKMSDLYQNLSKLFLTEMLPIEMIKQYLFGNVEECDYAQTEMIEFIAGHLKDEIAFSTSFPIMDAIEQIINDNKSNENLIVLDK